jgi:hypothetical protein
LAARFLFVIAVAFVVTSDTASAAPLKNVSYEVTGGTFNGLYSSGAIVSGTVTYTPTVPTSTPFTTYEPGNWNLALSGPSGTFQVTFVASALVFSPANSFVIYAAAAVPTHGPVLSNGYLLPHEGVRFFTFGGPGYSIIIRGSIPCCAPCPDCGTPIGHGFEVGNEVRTFVPEPATGTLVGLGLVLMGFVGGSRAAAARARRARVS